MNYNQAQRTVLKAAAKQGVKAPPSKYDKGLRYAQGALREWTGYGFDRVHDDVGDFVSQMKRGYLPQPLNPFLKRHLDMVLASTIRRKRGESEYRRAAVLAQMKQLIRAIQSVSRKVGR